MGRRVGPRDALNLCADVGYREHGLRGHPIEQVRVVVRNGNYSAFSGYRFTRSSYSGLRCLACGTYWRTNAAYVGGLPDASDGERALVPRPRRA